MLVRVLGPVRAEQSDGTPIPLRFMERKLIAALVATRPRSVSTEELAAALWSDAPPPSARKTIQTVVHRVRRVLGRDAIVTVADGYTFGSGIEVDVDDIPALLQQPTDDRCDPVGERCRAVPLVDLLDWPDSQPLRARVAELLRSAESDRLAAMVEAGDPAAVAAAESYVAWAPLDESAWCLLIRALCAAGRTHEAIRAYERARRTVADELGVSPGPSLYALYESVLCSDSDAPSQVVSAAEPSSLARAEAALRRSGSGWQTCLDSSDPVIVELDAALAGIRPGPTPLRARLLARWAVVCSHHRPAAECIDAARRSMATADALQSPELIAEAAHALSVVLADPRSDTERRRWVAVLLGLADAHGRRDWRMWAMPIMARSECLAGRLTTACGMLEELGGPESMLLRASVSGDWNAARGAAAALRMLQAKRLFDPNAAALQEMGILGILAMHEGTAFTDGATYLEWPTDPLTWSMWAWDAASSAQSGNLDRATVLLDGVASAELSALERDGYFLPLLAMLADAAHRCGHQAVAESVAQHVEPFIGMTIVDPGLLYRGAASHAAGLVASTRGHRDAARALLNDAVELHRAHRSRWMLQRSLDALAELG